jgi:hypothetical protein
MEILGLCVAPFRELKGYSLDWTTSSRARGGWLAVWSELGVPVTASPNNISVM